VRHLLDIQHENPEIRTALALEYFDEDEALYQIINRTAQTEVWQRHCRAFLVRRRWVVRELFSSLPTDIVEQIVNYIPCMEYRMTLHGMGYFAHRRDFPVPAVDFDDLYDSDFEI
jgi:hypothetical protein